MGMSDGYEINRFKGRKKLTLRLEERHLVNKTKQKRKLLKRDGGKKTRIFFRK